MTNRVSVRTSKSVIGLEALGLVTTTRVTEPRAVALCLFCVGDGLNISVTLEEILDDGWFGCEGDGSDGNASELDWEGSEVDTGEDCFDEPFDNGLDRGAERKSRKNTQPHSTEAENTLAAMLSMPKFCSNCKTKYAKPQ